MPLIHQEDMSERLTVPSAPVVAPIAPREGGSRIDQAEDVPEEPVPITEQELVEYREQDRYLPVSNGQPLRFSSDYSL